MKKVLLLAILALSFNVVAQDKSFLSESFISAEKLNSKMEEKQSKTYTIKPTLDLLQMFEERAINQIALIQKQDSVRQWTWDETTVNWMNQSKTIDMVYNANHQLTSSTEQIWKDNAWENSTKTFSSYKDYIITGTLWQKWINNEWQNSMQFNSTFDANNNLETSKTEMWENNGWKVFSLGTFTYDANRNILTRIIQGSYLGPFENLSKTTFTYDANNNLLTEVEQNWSVDKWVDSKLTEYTYDAKNNKLTETEQTKFGPIWMSTKKFIFTYDGRNNILTEVNQTSNGQALVNKWQFIYTYDAHDNILTETDKDWSIINNEWVNKSKYIYSYNNQNRPLTDLYQLWTNNDWKNESQSIMTYDMNNNRLTETDQDWIENVWQTTRTSLYTYNASDYLISNSDKDWDIDGITVLGGDSTHYYYSEHNTNTLDIKAEDITIYPNPSAGKINIIANNTIEAVRVFSLTGELIYTKLNINANTAKINLSNNIKGVFVLKIEQHGKTIVKKIVVE